MRNEEFGGGNCFCSLFCNFAGKDKISIGFVRWCREFFVSLQQDLGAKELGCSVA